MDDLRQRQFERILLIKPSSLGDVIHALPVLNGLRQRYPRAHLAWLINNHYAPLLQGHPHLDMVIGFDREMFRSLGGVVKGLPSVLNWAGRLREQHFDLAIDLAGLFRSGLLAALSGAEVRLGFDPAREGAAIFYNATIPVPEGPLHAVDKNYLAARTLGFDDMPLRFELPVSPKAAAQVADRLRSAGWQEAEPLVVVLPGSRWETKNWPVDHFRGVLQWLQSRGVRIVLAGGAAEAEICSRMASGCEPWLINWCGATTLPEMVALVDRAAVVLCNDSAPMHIAAARGRRVVAIFGPTDPRRTGPYGQLQQVERLDLACSPCYLRRLADCPHQHQCLQQLPVEQVVRAIEAVLPQPGSGASNNHA
ncbi:MAG: Lipopolysaccharide core heptosyltransferase RfaQ [Phycisphaerae bacterium]|nr:Lipopolysaccharide core heptosyltransferase RfaQ [Phycisphaerae bacterium]